MQTFDQFLSQLIVSVSNSPAIKVRNELKKIVGMSRFATKNYPDGEYIKIVLDDHSLMLIVIGEKEIYYTDMPLGKIESISDDMVATADKLNFQGKDYEVVNQNDYQFVLQKYVGGINDIEGECIFSDFVPTDGSKAMLSLGIISATNERADVYCELIKLDEIEL